MTLTEQKAALVTGAAQGIGEAIAIALAKDGFNVALADLPFQEQAAAKVIKKIQAEAPNSKSIFIACDVTKRLEVFDAVLKTYAEFGSFDVIVNNAGSAVIRTIMETTEEDSWKTWNLNVNGVLWGIQAALEKFIELKHPNGKIINGCSIAGYREAEGLSMYGPSKHAVRGLTKTSARELAKYKITVNSYCPGIVKTPLWDKIDEGLSEIMKVERGVPTQSYLDAIALGRLQEPADVSGLVCFLASDRSDYITGQSMIVDGGIVFS